VGRWQFQPVNGSWDYDWMEFFEDGGYTDSWGNTRTWSMVSSNRLKLVRGFGAGTFLYDVKITGNRLEITDEYGNSAVGTRVSSYETQNSGRSTGGPLWVLLIPLAAGAAIVYFLVRRRSQRPIAPADAAAPVAPAFCMHCGQPVQAGHKFCQHCGKPLR